MKTSYRTGMRAEILCRWVLRLKGYRILATRYQSSRGEIDIVAKKGQTLAIVEVKARATRDEAISAILPRQQYRVRDAALDYLARHPHFKDCVLRFDAMLVASRRWPQHLVDAWQPEQRR